MEEKPNESGSNQKGKSPKKDSESPKEKRPTTEDLKHKEGLIGSSHMAHHLGLKRPY